MDMQHLSHSRIRCYQHCPRAFEIKYERGIVPVDQKSQSLRMGHAFHQGIEALSCGALIETVESDIRLWYANNMPQWVRNRESADDWQTECEIVVALLIGYQERWASSPVRTIAAEHEFDLPVINPATGRESLIYRVRGFIDRIVEWEGRLAVLESKTTSETISDHTDNYWQRLKIDSQISLYMWAARQCGYAVETVVYDVIKKPGIRPKNMTAAEANLLTKDGVYYGQSLPHYAGRDMKRENAELYGARLLADLRDRPLHYYQRKEIARTEDDLLDFQRELWHHQKLIRESQRHNYFPRNTHACYQPYRCDYVNICMEGRNLDHGIPEGFVSVKELEKDNATNRAEDQSVNAVAIGSESESF